MRNSEATGEKNAEQPATLDLKARSTNLFWAKIALARQGNRVKENILDPRPAEPP